MLCYCCVGTHLASIQISTKQIVVQYTHRSITMRRMYRFDVFFPPPLSPLPCFPCLPSFFTGANIAYDTLSVSLLRSFFLKLFVLYKITTAHKHHMLRRLHVYMYSAFDSSHFVFIRLSML